MDNFNVHHMKSSGHFYTWNSKQHGDRRVFSKIDCAICNDEWHSTFPATKVTFLHEGSFDQSPILVQLFPQVNT